MKITVRDIVTPATIGLFFVSAISGVALFFHWQPGFFHSAHEWLSMPFVAIALWHAVRNGRSIMNYLGRPVAVAIVAAVLVLSAGYGVVAGSGQGQGGEPMAVARTLAKAPLASAAGAFGLSTDHAIAALSARGWAATSDQSIATIAQNGKTSPLAVLTALAAAANAP